MNVSPFPVWAYNQSNMRLALKRHSVPLNDYIVQQAIYKTKTKLKRMHSISQINFIEVIIQRCSDIAFIIGSRINESILKPN